jgi:hypothetical protein
MSIQNHLANSWLGLKQKNFVFFEVS